MIIYDEIIRELNTLLSSYKKKVLTPEPGWMESSKNELIFRSDEAYTLGGGDKISYSQAFVTSDESLLGNEEIVLIGEDLTEIKSDIPYARIELVSFDDENIKSSNDLYGSLMKIDYTRYHIHPKGFMMLISAINHKEIVRLSKEAVRNHISFASVGKMVNDKYKENKNVKSVKTIFITDPLFDYKALEELIAEASGITKALDHLSKDIKMDCNACSLKPVCEQVEGMVNKEFKNEQEPD